MNFFLIKKIKLVALTLFIVSTISLIGSILLHNFLVNFKIDYPILFIKEFHDVKSGEKIKILCNENYKCLTKVGEKADSILTWDENHFTEKGSKFVFSKFVD